MIAPYYQDDLVTLYLGDCREVTDYLCRNATVGAMKLVYPAALILRSFLEDPAVSRYGIEFMGGLGISSGALYPILHRLETEGLIVSEWERIDPHEQERPARRYYRLTPDGEQLARRELAALADRLRPPVHA